MTHSTGASGRAPDWRLGRRGAFISGYSFAQLDLIKLPECRRVVTVRGVCCAICWSVWVFLRSRVRVWICINKQGEQDKMECRDPLDLRRLTRPTLRVCRVFVC